MQDFSIAPLILTLQLDDATQNFFNGIRGRYFPAERNFLSAHLTLFHAIPDALRAAFEEALSREASSTQLVMRVTQLRSIGRGVAYFIESQTLMTLHRRLATQFAAHLTAQDAQPLRPHVTVQNKVTSTTAASTLVTLNSSFVPFDCRGVSLELWRYAGGPWEPLQRFRFSGTS